MSETKTQLDPLARDPETMQRLTTCSQRKWLREQRKHRDRLLRDEINQSPYRRAI